MSITDEEGEEIGEEAGDPELARQVLQKGYADLKARGLKEEVSKRFESFIILLLSLLFRL